MSGEILPMHSLLSRVELEPTKNGGMNIVITLTGHEMAIAADQRILESQEQDNLFGSLFIERGQDNKSITIRAALSPEDTAYDHDKKTSILVNMIYEATKCRLGGMKLRPAAVPVVEHEGAHTPYSAAVIVERTIDRSDRQNLVGKYCQEVLRKQHSYRGDIKDMVYDPRPDDSVLRLLDVRHPFDSEQEALYRAEKLLNKTEKDFGIYYNKPMNLFLSELHTQPLDIQTRKQIDLYKGMLTGKNLSVTHATLNGSDEMLTKAERALHNSFPANMFKQIRRDDSLDVILCGDDHSDPGRLLATVHGRTRCKLPMDISASATADPNKPSYFNPCLETAVWDDMPEKNRGTLGTALAHYVGMQIPDSSILIPERTSRHKEYAPARVIINRHCKSLEEAKEIAEELKEGVTARLRRGDSPHIL